MIGYKVVRSCKRRRHLVSYFQKDKTHGETRYIIGKEISRKKHYGPLGVFDLLTNVENFLFKERNDIEQNELTVMVYQCEYRQSKDDHFWNLINRWENENNPPGTILADKVKLIKKVGMWKYDPESERIIKKGF